jgi:hypothetical protein
MPRLVFACLSCVLASTCLPAAAAFVPDGLYEVQVHLEVPHVMQPQASRTVTVCLAASMPGSPLPMPVLSANNPFGRCVASAPVESGDTLAYLIGCGTGAASAKASYRRRPTGFDGRITMVMGGKNMTMTEVQNARRVGECQPGPVEPMRAPAAAPR